MARHNAMAAQAVVMNRLTSGETQTLAAMPAGARVPNSTAETGAVVLCAPKEDATEADSFGGKMRTV